MKHIIHRTVFVLNIYGAYPQNYIKINLDSEYIFLKYLEILLVRSVSRTVSKNIAPWKELNMPSAGNK